MAFQVKLIELMTRILIIV